MTILAAALTTALTSLQVEEIVLVPDDISRRAESSSNAGRYDIRTTNDCAVKNMPRLSRDDQRILSTSG